MGGSTEMGWGRGRLISLQRRIGRIGRVRKENKGARGDGGVVGERGFSGDEKRL